MADHRPGTHRGGASKSAQIGRTGPAAAAAGYREPLRDTAGRGGTNSRRHADRTDRAEALGTGAAWLR